jgi:L-seryl-tRNA(Ser) seleniumtransferase
MTALLESARTRPWATDLSHAELTDALRAAVDRLRLRWAAGDADAPACTPDAICDDAAAIIDANRSMRLSRVINATGVILHTGLGRSALAPAAVRRLQEAVGSCNLELDLPSGRRGRRGAYAENLLRRLTGAEAAMIVNNNAAATMIALRGLAAGREVIVSRGQLIEIGGSFRMPDVMAAGGAILREVGTTNKTHLRDYESAISDRTAMIMHVHTSNYRVVGFTEAPPASALAKLARERGLIMFDDLGSGALLPDDLWTQAGEPTVTDSLRAGAHFVCFSGDKLLGGPQAGILLGDRETIERLRRDPMARALRVDKLAIAALEATLELYLDPDRARTEIPVLAALTESLPSVRKRAEKLVAFLKESLPGETFAIEDDESFAGGGSLPAWPVPTVVVRWQPTPPLGVNELARRLRLTTPAVLPRVRDDSIIFDLRSIAPNDLRDLATQTANAVAGPCG